MSKARLLLIAVGVLAFAVLLWACTFVVRPGQPAFVLNFGAPIRGPITQPGWCWKAPWQRVKVLDTRLQLLHLPPIERFTAEGRPVVVQLYAAWRIATIGTTVLLESGADLNSVERHLSDLVLAELDQQISSTQLADWLDQRCDDQSQAEPSLELCATRIREGCRSLAAERWGVELADVRIWRISMPESQRESMLAHMRAVRERRRQVEYIRALLNARQILAAARVDAEAVRRQAVQRAGLIRGEGHRQAETLLSDARREEPRLSELIEALIMRRELPAATQPTSAAAPLSDQPVNETQPAQSKPAL